MKSKVYNTLITLAATTIAPCGLIAYFCMAGEEHEFILTLGVYLLVHTAIWLALIPAFRKFPRTSWALCTLFYPIVALTGMIFVINPAAAFIFMAWFGPGLCLLYSWIAIPVSGVSATIAYLLTRTKTNTENTDRGTAAPTS